MKLRFPILALIMLISVVSGCAEGPFWRTGQYSPWVRNQWSAEEQLADTLFERKRILNEKVADVESLSPSQQDKVANELTKIVQNDPIVLIRLHAVKLLGQLNSPTAIAGLEFAAKDHRMDVRLAAIRALENHSDDVAVPILQELLGSDMEVDVRLAATKALGRFPGKRTVEVLAQALNDPDPALQFRATESLAKVTGEEIGPDVKLWQQYVNQYLPATSKSPQAIATKKRSQGNDIAREKDGNSFIR